MVARDGGTNWAIGILLGLAGALLDFYSSYQLLVQSGTAGEMGMATTYSSSGYAWGIGVAALGVVLALTSISYSRPSRMNRMQDFGSLMMVYGFVMLFIGGSMYLGITSMANGVILPGVGMLAVGVLMVVNGALMRRSYMQSKMP